MAFATPRVSGKFWQRIDMTIAVVRHKRLSQMLRDEEYGEYGKPCFVFAILKTPIQNDLDISTLALDLSNSRNPQLVS